jgi:CubicO group peptidase (beta-lactamase class C family)
MAVLLAFAVAAPPRARAADAPKDIAGLWKAKHLVNTSGARGPVIVRHDAGGWQAEIAGWSAPVRVDDRTISFELSGALGSFTGRWEAQRTRIAGHWIQPPNVDAGVPYASPLTLLRDGAVWRGNVVPLDDPMTFFLTIAPAAAGDAPRTRGAFIVNPERNLGWMWRVDRLERDGSAVKLIASPQRKNGVVAQGTYREADDVLSFYFDGRGGTYDFARVGADDATEFYPRGRPGAPYTYARPVAEHDGWATASLEDVGFSRPRIESFIRMLIDTPMDSVHAPQVHGVLIARHGKLVLEEYFHGESRDRPHETRSAAKSVTATLFGAAMQAGLPVSTSMPVYRAMHGGTFPPDLDPRARALTVDSLLTMSSGLDCDDGDDASPGREETMWDLPPHSDFYKFALDLKMIRPPGQRSVYCSIQPNLVGGVLTRTTHQSLPVLFHELLAKPLQIGRYYLDLQPTGEVFMGGGLRMLPRDFMKFGQLMLAGGTWNGHRVLSRQWVAQASAPRMDLGRYKYGYLWWVIDFPYNGSTLRTYSALGNGGQLVMVIPKLDMVVAIYGANYADQGTFLLQTVYVRQYVLPAVID